MAKSIDFIINNKKWQEKENNAFKLIDEIRNQYLNSNEVVLVQDYGAGSVVNKRTKRNWQNGIDSERKVSEICQSASSPEKWGKLIFKIIREVNPSHCLELGTSLGISAAYQISALKLNNGGSFTTIEGAKEVAQIAEINLKKINYPNYQVEVGKFNEVLPEILKNNKVWDFVFIDGHHDKTATKAYFELIFPFLSERAIIIFDDINWSAGMKEVWQEIHLDQRIKLSFETSKWGICVIDKNRTVKETKHIHVSL